MGKFHPATINPKDPLAPSKPIAPDAARELFKRLSALSSGFSSEDVVGAATNLLVNAIRQRQPKRFGAERQFDEAFGRAKHTLLEQHYDLAGNRRNIFPFDQFVEPEHFTDRLKG